MNQSVLMGSGQIVYNNGWPRPTINFPVPFNGVPTVTVAITGFYCQFKVTPIKAVASVSAANVNANGFEVACNLDFSGVQGSPGPTQQSMNFSWVAVG